MAEVPHIRLGVDIGGTFTDIVLRRADGTTAVRKVSSTTADYAQAIVSGLGELLAAEGLAAGAIGEIVHGTTVATNAILEGNGARTGLLTTKGFRDILEIRRLRYPQLYNLDWEKPVPLVRRRLRLEVDERMDHRGQVVRPLDMASAEASLDEAVVRGAESLAICFLHSYANPAHEQQVAELVRRKYPGLYLSVSSDILPQIKEYERTSTAVANAYIMPLIDRYLASLAGELATIGVETPILVMQSNGGVMSAEAARRQPVHIVESGPAAGAIAAAALARTCGYGNLIALDMGGTTAKASIVEGGELSRAPEYEVGSGISIGSRLNRGAGYLLGVPAIDIAEVGAGGGSIIWLDRAGAPQVGPQSAGAVPGPLCYDTGGSEPTLTDANLLLGYLNPRYLAGGALKLNYRRARDIFQRKVAEKLGLTTEEAAYGAHRIGSASMTRAVRAVSIERGRDPRDFALLAFGGSGPLHAAEVARTLDICRVIVPPAPGLFSAYGLLSADIEYHFLRTYLRRTADLTYGELESVWCEMARRAGETMAGDGFPDVEMRQFADLRYAGQSFELTVPADGRKIGELEEAFSQEHERTYGHRALNDPVELVNLRLVVQALPSRAAQPAHAVIAAAGASGEAVRPAYFGAPYGTLPTPVLGRRDLGCGQRRGPLIIEEYDATAVVPPGCVACLDEHCNILIEVGDRGE
ncbi:MAG: hydantoinase/oxoprolinase family protein [Chloroflexi bacterium]|nr:hydantoinase/oxoprolinase family protein [Chloroflexota bacterium]